ncbi:hypothetical protein GA0115257_106918 [Streptomyces sp. LcepLS]|nr:hypothetical protein GA0115257_106918 [Streptomyces sp. LcepLS]
MDTGLGRLGAGPPLLRTGPRAEQRLRLGLPQAAYGLDAGQGREVRAERLARGLVALGRLPQPGEDVVRDLRGGLVVAEDAAGEAVHERRETVVQLAERRRLPAFEPLPQPRVAAACLLHRPKTPWLSGRDPRKPASHRCSAHHPLPRPECKGSPCFPALLYGNVRPLRAWRW